MSAPLAGFFGCVALLYGRQMAINSGTKAAGGLGAALLFIGDA